jgi:hypothetical protein
MPVVWKGSGVSGNRENTPAPVPSADGEFTQSQSSKSMPSTVSMKGGTSGDDNSYLPNISAPFNSQIPQDSASNSQSGNIQWSQNTGNREGAQDPPVPTCGTPNDAAV